MAELRFAPLRSLADFALGSARFGLPDFKDPVRCNNRIVSNLLYYQSNYLLVVAAVVLLVGYMQPLQMCLGPLVLGCISVTFVYASENHLALRRFRRNHSGIYTAAILAASLLLLQLLGCILVFLFGIALPILGKCILGQSQLPFPFALCKLCSSPELVRLWNICAIGIGFFSVFAGVFG